MYEIMLENLARAFLACQIMPQVEGHVTQFLPTGLQRSEQHS